MNLSSVLKKLGLVIPALMLIGIVATSATTSILSVSALDDSETYYGETKKISLDTTNVNQFLFVAMGPFNGALKYRIKSGGVWSGWALVDSFSTTAGVVRHYSGITNDSLMRHGMPPLPAPGDTTSIAGRSILKQTEAYFEMQFFLETGASGNSGSAKLMWID